MDSENGEISCCSQGLLYLSVIGLLVFTETAVSHGEMVSCYQAHTCRELRWLFPSDRGCAEPGPFGVCLLRDMKTISEALEAFLLSASFSRMWDKSHLETSPRSEAMSSALERILGHGGFFNFILFYFLRYKFRNSLKLCPYGLDILKTTAGFSPKDTMEFVDKIKDRRTVSPKAHRSY